MSGSDRYRERSRAIAENLPDWVEFPIVELVQKRFGVPVLLDNDANAAALGEFFYGAGRGFKDVFYVTISTGIGGAIICEGQIYHGVQAGAGEIGHTVVQPERVRLPLRQHRMFGNDRFGHGHRAPDKEKLAAQNGNSVAGLEQITAETVVEAVRAAMRRRFRSGKKRSDILGIGIGNAITLIAPEAVIIGGGVAAAGELLLQPSAPQIRKNVSMVPIEKVEILNASLGSESGVCGALMLAQKAY